MATDSNNKVLNVPPLRFPEFTGEWRKYKVSDILDFYSTNSLSWEQLDYNADNILNLHYGLIHVGLPILVNLRNTVLPNIKDENIPKNYELCRVGDIAFADASEDTNDVAKAIEFVDINDKKVICGLHTIHGRDTNNITVTGFKGYAFASPTFHNQIRRIAQGTKIYSISSKNFAECFIGIPSKVEQTKIAGLFSLLDERIATQSRIIDKLQSLMSGIRHNVFCKIKDWEKLSTVVQRGEIALNRGNVIPKFGFSKEFCYPVYSSSIQNNGLMGYYNSYMFDRPLISWSIDAGETFSIVPNISSI